MLMLKRLSLGAVLGAIYAAGISTASAQTGLITCWYNEKDAYTGADDAQPGYGPGLRRVDQRGDYTWAYTIRAPDGTSCPRKRPGS